MQIRPPRSPAFIIIQTTTVLGVSYDLDRNLGIVPELFARVCLDRNRCHHVGGWQDIKYCVDEFKVFYDLEYVLGSFSSLPKYSHNNCAGVETLLQRCALL